MSLIPVVEGVFFCLIACLVAATTGATFDIFCYSGISLEVSKWSKAQNPNSLVEVMTTGRKKG